MKTLAPKIVTGAAALALQLNAWAAQTIKIDFEGLSDAPEFALTHEQGVTFENVVVMTPATVRTSTGPDLTAATSGQSAASTFGAKMRFSAPVVQITLAVSPSFVSVNLLNERGYHTAHFKASAQDGSILRMWPHQSSAFRHHYRSPTRRSTLTIHGGPMVTDSSLTI